MVIIPALLPDELAPGYCGRILRLNGWREDRRDAMCMLGQFYGNEVTYNDVPMAELLAQMARVDLEHLVRNHSMYPLQRAVTEDVAGGLLGLGNHLHVLRVQRPWAYLCSACIEEDLAFHGVVYWRREHQIPGQYHCHKHGIPLLSVERRRDRAFHVSPAWALANAVSMPTTVLATSVSTPATARYLEICSHLLTSTKVMKKTDVSQVALKRAAQLGMRVDERLILRNLLWSAGVQNCYDARWLDSLAYECTNHRNSKGIPSAGGMAHSTFVSALIFGALYETADEAINAMTRVWQAESQVVNLASQPSPP